MDGQESQVHLEHRYGREGGEWEGEGGREGGRGGSHVITVSSLTILQVKN